MLKYLIIALLAASPVMAASPPDPTLEDVKQSGAELAGNLSGVVISLQAKLAAALREIETLKKPAAQ